MATSRSKSKERYRFPKEPKLQECKPPALPKCRVASLPKLPKLGERSEDGTGV